MPFLAIMRLMVIAHPFAAKRRRRRRPRDRHGGAADSRTLSSMTIKTDAVSDFLIFIPANKNHLPPLFE